MSSFFNPFREIFEVRALPLARIYRTNFWQKLKDTFNVFAGNGLMFPEKQFDIRESHLGLFDYASLGIGYLLAQMGAHAFKAIEAEEHRPIPDKPWVKLGRCLMLAFWSLGQGLRYLTAASLTLLVSPFVGLAHLATAARRKKLLNKIRQTKHRIFFSEGHSVGQMLTLWEKKIVDKPMKEYQEKEVIEYLDVDYLKTKTDTRVHLFINPITSPYNPNLNPDCERKVHNDPAIPEIREQLPHSGFSYEEAKASDSTVHAFIELNVGNLAQKLEERGYFDPKNRATLFNTTQPVTNNNDNFSHHMTPRT